MLTRRDTIFGATTALAAVPFINRSVNAGVVLRQRVVNSPPHCVRLDDGTWSGFDMQMSEYLCRCAGVLLKPSREYLAWPRAIKAMRDGELIQLLTSVSFREERTEFLDYICPYDYEQIVIITRRKNAHIDFSSMEDFTQSVLPIERDGSTRFYQPFDTRYDEDPDFAAHFVEVSATGSGDALEHRISLAKRIQRERIFGVMTDWYIGRAVKQLSEELIGFSQDELVVTPVKLFGTPTTYLTASKMLPEDLREALRMAAAKARENGEFARIWSEWFADRPLPSRE